MNRPPAALRPAPIRRLRFEEVAPGCAYHAALVAADSARARGFQITSHSHDFYELMCPLAGEAIHSVNGAPTTVLRPGALVLLRPDDWHFVRFQTGRLLHYINIAVPADMWRGFASLAGTQGVLDAPNAPRPLSVALSPVASEECVGAFRRALERWQAAPAGAPLLRVEACRLLAAVMPWLCQSASEEGDAPGGALGETAPPWLARACRVLASDADVLRAGLPAFVAQSGVSRTHLARVLKSVTGQTPTAYINTVRVERAARLLTTTTLSILDIAGECGFDQPSYFYRCFRKQFGASPHAYRVAASRRVAPETPPLKERS